MTSSVSRPGFRASLLARSMIRVLRLLPPLLTLVLLAGAGLVVTGHLRLEPILTGSMAPRYPAGALVAVTPIEGRALHVGDIVMFVPPPPFGTPGGGPIMHRVISTGTAPDGHLQLRTKGDANSVADPWVLDGTKGTFARLRASSVLAGRALFMIRSTGHFPAALVWPGLFVLLAGLRQSRKNRPDQVEVAEVDLLSAEVAVEAAAVEAAAVEAAAVEGEEDEFVRVDVPAPRRARSAKARVSAVPEVER